MDGCKRVKDMMDLSGVIGCSVAWLTDYFDETRTLLRLAHRW